MDVRRSSGLDFDCIFVFCGHSYAFGAGIFYIFDLTCLKDLLLRHSRTAFSCLEYNYSVQDWFTKWNLVLELSS